MSIEPLRHNRAPVVKSQFVHSSGCKTLSIFPLEFKSNAGMAQVGSYEAINGDSSSLEQHLLNTHVVMEILDVPESWESAARMQMD